MFKWLIHNCLAHPLMGLIPCRVTYYLHDVTAPEEETYDAVFVVASTENGNIAAVTRPEGGIGLPGGMIEAGESLVQAALRETEEEGWSVDLISTVPAHTATVRGKSIVWLWGGLARKKEDWPEKGRIEPVEVSIEEVISSGLGNEWLAGCRAENI